MPVGLGFHVKAVFVLKKKLMVTCSLCLDYRATFRIGRVLAQTRDPGDLGVKKVSNAD